MGITAEFTGGCTDAPIATHDVPTAAAITGVLPRTTTALAPITPRPTTTVGTMGGVMSDRRGRSHTVVYVRFAPRKQMFGQSRVCEDTPCRGRSQDKRQTISRAREKN
jgi:hypothetical protein